MTGVIIVLRVIHIVSGIFWVGAALFTTFFLFPVLSAAGPAAGQIMAGLQQRRFMTVMPLSALLTMGAGLGLYWIVSGGAVLTYSTSRVGATLAVSALLAVIGFLVGMFVMRPASMEAGRLGRELASGTEGARDESNLRRLEHLQARAARASLTMAILLLLAAVGMAAARYV
jgi:uncharacterized membrane protein